MITEWEIRKTPMGNWRVYHHHKGWQPQFAHRTFWNAVENVHKCEDCLTVIPKEIYVAWKLLRMGSVWG
jgi:hypothetical protein